MMRPGACLRNCCACESATVWRTGLRSGAPAFSATQIPAIRAQALERRVSGASQMMALTAEKHPVPPGQSDHGTEVIALGTVGTAHGRSKLLPSR